MPKLRQLWLRSPSPSNHSPLKPKVERELEDLKGTLDELVGAVGEYGHHLRSHTTILKSMSEASQSLAAIVADLHVHMKARDRNS